MKSSSVSFVSVLLTLITLPAMARETPIVGQRTPASASAEAPRQSPDTGIAELPNERSARQHRGFYLRAEIGGGYRSFSTEADGLAMRVSGAGGAASLLAGGTPLPNLVLLGEFSVSGLSNPTIQINERSAEANDASVSLLAFGPGLIYYVMPANVSLGASVVLTRLGLKQDGETSATTEPGIGGVVRLGKEWWVGPHMGLGLSSQCTIASMKDKSETAATWLGTAFTLSATLTYN
jgi:hypothetical protein